MGGASKQKSDLIQAQLQRLPKVLVEVILAPNATKDRTRKNPTDCYWEIDTKSGNILHDSQGCLTWSLNPNGKVYVENGTCVGVSLPEFLTRINMENALWYKTNARFAKQAGPLLPAESASLAHYDRQNKYLVS